MHRHDDLFKFFVENRGANEREMSFVLGAFIGVFEERFFFCRKGLLGFILCVLSPALFTTKRAAKFAEFEREIVLKIIEKRG